jgi:predicted nucleic acid-binding protein
MPTPDSLFVDTSGWLAYINGDDPFYSSSLAHVVARTSRNHTLVTTSAVMSELVTLMTSRLRRSRKQLLETIDLLKADPLLELLFVEKTTDDAAWDLLRQRLDKEWSHVDAIRFVIMQQHGLTEALTTDHHFEQAGFVRLLV